MGEDNRQTGERKRLITRISSKNEIFFPKSEASEVFGLNVFSSPSTLETIWVGLSCDLMNSQEQMGRSSVELIWTRYEDGVRFMTADDKIQ